MEDERLERPTGARWDDVINQQEALGEDYRHAGWTVIELHPGDVSVRDPADHDRFGFDIVVPGREFDDLRGILDTGAHFDGYELFGDVEQSVAVVLVVLEDADTEVAVLYPLYYARRSVAEVREAAIDDGTLYSVIRPLDRRAEVTFTHEDPGLFFGRETD